MLNRLNWSQSPQATANFGLVLIVLVFNCIVIHRNTMALQTLQESINHANLVLIRTQTLLSSLSDAESDVRGFAITGDEAFLTVYRQMLTTVPDQLRLLQSTVKDQPQQMERLPGLTQHVDRRMSHLRSVIEARESTGFEAAQERVMTHGGREEMEQIRQIVDDMQAEETKLLTAKSLSRDKSLFIVLSANLAAVCIGTALTVVAWYLVERELRKRRLAEANAQSERQNLWATLTSIADGVIVVDTKGDVKLANPIARQLMGRTQDVIGRPLSSICTIMNETTREPIVNPVSRVLASGQIAEEPGQNVLLRTDGTEIPVEQSAAPIRDASGELSGVIFVFRDCSARRRAEAELRERERRFQRMFETPLIGIAIATQRGNLLEANDSFLGLIGHQREELNVASLSWSGVPSGQSPLDDAARQELRETGVCSPFERTNIRADGTRLPLLISAARLMDHQDLVVIFVTDLSESKRAEEALRETEARFRILSECMPQKVWTSLPDGQLNYLNHMLLEYAGLPAEQLKGWGWTNLVHPDDLRNQIDTWKQSLSSGDMFEIEHRILKHNGEYRWHLARALPLYQPDTQISMWIGTNTDIHDQKQAEEELREDHRRKDKFLALLAHELRNPLAPLSNAVQILGSSPSDSQTQLALIGIMQRQVRQLTRLIDDLLDLSRITTGRMRLQRDRILAESVVTAAVEAIQPLITERQQQLIVTVPKEELWLDADAARLSQILTNLLHNAAKYTPPQGRLNLTLERAEDDVLFKVSDNGAGISSEMLTKIFDLFMQIDWTLDQANGGLGIGLTLVRTLVELHGGSVKAASDGLGQGSEFTVRLPAADAPASATMAAVEHTAKNESIPVPVLRVLVVDDVQASAKTLALMLRTIGQNVEVAFDGASAISRVKETEFDLVFLDIAMPGMDGLEVARQIRSMPEGHELTLVALTGFGQEEDRQRSLQAGFDNHITKPTSLDILKTIVRSIPGNRDRKKETRRR